MSVIKWQSTNIKRREKKTALNMGTVEEKYDFSTDLIFA